MKKFSYKTVFVWNSGKLYIFYKYQSGLYIPAGIDFKYRNKQYTTIQLMSTLVKLYNLDKFPTDIYKTNYWFEKIEEKFVKFYKKCS